MKATEIAPGLIIAGITPPLHLNDFKLIAFDMDSSPINIDGDGANDLPMKAQVSLLGAFHAIPAVREFANVSIEVGGLDRLLTLFQP